MLFRYLSSVDRTHVGRRRSNNEDALLRIPDHGVFCVADGMGGTDAGEIASGRIVEALGQAVVSERAGRTLYDFEAKQRLIDETLNGASLWINRRAAERGRGGSGSTVVMLVFDALAPEKAVALHAGDSRVYRYRNGKLEQVTRDHSLAEEAGYKDESKMPKQFRGVVTRGVGIKETVSLEKTPVDVCEGDLFLLCSDGLSRMVPDKELRSILKGGEELDLAELANRLIDTANANGGVDNVSVILVKAGKLEAAVPPDDYLDLVESDMQSKPEGRITEEMLRRTDETADLSLGAPDTPERHTEEMPGPPGPERRIPQAIAHIKPRHIAIGTGGILLAVLLALVLGPSSNRSKEWAASLELERGRTEAPAAYARRLNSHLDECRARRADRDHEVLADTEKQIEDRLSSLSATVRRRFDVAVTDGDVTTATTVLAEWDALRSCLDLISLSADAYARQATEMQTSLALAQFTQRVEAATRDLSLDEKAVAMLERFQIEAVKGPDGKQPAWSAQGKVVAKEAAIVWVRLFGNRFSNQLAEMGAELKPLLSTWDSLRNHQLFVDALGAAYVDQNVAIGQGLVMRASRMRSDVRAAALRRDVQAAREALQRLQAFAVLAEGTSFHAEVAEIARSAARIVESAGNAQAGLREAVYRFVSRVTRASQCDVATFASLSADYKTLSKQDGLRDEERQRMRQAIEQTFTRTVSDRARICLNAYESLDLEAGDRHLRALRKTAAALPQGVGMSALRAPLTETSAAREGAIRRVTGIERELETIGSTVLESPPSAWQGLAQRLLDLRPYRTCSKLAADRWTEAHARHVRRILSYAREYAPAVERETRVMTCRQLLKNESVAGLLDEDTRHRLESAIGQINTEQHFLTRMQALTAEAASRDWTVLTTVLRKLAERISQTLERLAGKQQWLTTMASGPLDPEQLLLHGQTVQKAKLDCDDVWIGAITRAVGIGAATQTRRANLTDVNVTALERIEDLSKQLKRGSNGSGGTDLATLQALLAEVQAYGP